MYPRRPPCPVVVSVEVNEEGAQRATAGARHAARRSFLGFLLVLYVYRVPALLGTGTPRLNETGENWRARCPLGPGWNCKLLHIYCRAPRSLTLLNRKNRTPRSGKRGHIRRPNEVRPTHLTMPRRASARPRCHAHTPRHITDS